MTTLAFQLPNLGKHGDMRANLHSLARMVRRQFLQLASGCRVLILAYSRSEFLSPERFYSPILRILFGKPGCTGEPCTPGL